MATNRHPTPHAHSWYDTPILGQPHQLRRLLRTPRTIPAQTFCPNVSAKVLTSTVPIEVAASIDA